MANYRGFTPAHARSNERYLQKFKTKSIRIGKDQWSAVETHYTALGHSSFAGYVSALIAADMASQRNTERLKGIAEDPLEGQEKIIL